MSLPAILLDRDGVINVNRRDHVKSWSEFEFVSGVLEALSALSQLRLPMVIVSNQAVVQRGIISESELDAIHQRMLAEIQRAGARIDRVFYCPHDESERCNCRKPEPGMIFRAAEELDLDLAHSVFVGDAFTDVLAGDRAKCKTVLVLTGRGKESVETMRRSATVFPDVIEADLRSAVPTITAMLGNVPMLLPVAAPHFTETSTLAALG